MTGLSGRFKSVACAGAILALGAVVWGEAGRSPAPPARTAPPAQAGLNSADLPAARFAKRPAVRFDSADGQVLALQLVAKLDPAPARPRDLVFVLDTSASQAGDPLRDARSAVSAVAAQLKPEDRVSLRTANTPAGTKALTGGLLGSTEAKLRARLKDLDAEFPAGATDLEAALVGALKEFDNKASRQQVVVYLGDGESALAPLSEKSRVDLARRFAEQSVQFFAVPLGTRIDSANVHGLSAGTGGAVVRFNPSGEANPALAFAAQILDRLAVPVVAKPTLELVGVEGVEILPGKLPPLRGDAPTLVMVRAKSLPASVEAKVSGVVANKSVAFAQTFAVPLSEADDFFLAGLFTQWQASGLVNAPAILRADRTLALAYEQHRVAVDECVSQAGIALNSFQFNAAKAMFQAALKIDPRQPEAGVGLKVVEKYQKGDISKAEMNKILAVRQDEPKDAPKADPKVPADPKLAVDPKDVEPKLAAPTPVPVVSPNLIREEEARLAVRERQFSAIVDETLARGRQALRDGDPDASRAFVLGIRDQIRLQTELSPGSRDRLLARVEALLREVGTQGAAIKQRFAEEREREAKARQRVLAENVRVSNEEAIRERIRALAELMRQARFEEVYREAELLRQERIANAQPIPVESTALYHQGQVATNLREFRELVRLREDRFLLTMLQVEKSHVPYPDEPPVHFPPARVWKELTDNRRPYASTDLDPNMSSRGKARMRFLRRSLDEPNRDDKAHEGISLKEILNILSELNSPREADQDPSLRLKILVDEPSFKAAGGAGAAEGTTVLDTKINLPNLQGATLATVLRRITDQIGGTYLVRQDYIEITTAEKALRDKVVRAFPVFDLVIPLPNAIAQNTLNQNLQVLGSTFSLGGNPGATAFGFGGGFGGAPFGGNVNQMMGGMNPAQGLFMGNPGMNNMGAGGGVTGFSGGQLGQFGNLGGQFGFQGGDQSTILVQLIQQVVAQGEWTNSPQVLGGAAAGDPTADPGGDLAAGSIPQDQKNSIGYYSAAGALVVRATSRFHRNVDSRLRTGAPMMNVNARPNGNAVALTPKRAAQIVEELKKDPVEREKLAMGKPLDAAKMWQQALGDTRNKRSEPAAVVACVDFLSQVREFGHAAELLKASIREGITPAAWAHESLALALEGAQANPSDIERARLSAIDLNPRDASAYVAASRHMADAGKKSQAIELCKLAAKIQPDKAEIYTNALAYAGDLKSVDSDVSLWAANGLLQRDWPADSKEFHQQAKMHLTSVMDKLRVEKRDGESAKLSAALATDKPRDLSVELLWSGPAMLSLKVTEPSGSVSSSSQPQTTGGGTLQIADLAQAEDNRSEVYSASEAFSGSYQIEVDRQYGRPVANKATLKITRHAGTPNRSTELVTVDLSKVSPVRVELLNGRRSTLAQVAPPSDELVGKMKSSRGGLNEPVALTSGLRGGALASGNGWSMTQAAADSSKATPTNPAFTGRSSGNFGMEMNVTQKAGSGEMTFTPVFQTATGKATVKLAVVPGGE